MFKPSTCLENRNRYMSSFPPEISAAEPSACARTWNRSAYSGVSGTGALMSQTSSG